MKNFNKIIFIAGFIILIAQSRCVIEEEWDGCDGKHYVGDPSAIDDEKAPYRSPYYPNLEPICLGAPPKVAIRTKDSIRFNWRKETDFRYTKVIISTRSYVDYSSTQSGFDTASVVAVWDDSLPGVPGFLALDSFVTAPGGIPEDRPSTFSNDTSYYWAVWGFDRLGRLSHAS